MILRPEEATPRPRAQALKVRAGMPAAVHQYRIQVHDAAGKAYNIEAWGEKHGNVWYGWLEFLPLGGTAVLRTDRETTQPDWEALKYWASGLEPTYFEGAFQGAFPAPPSG